MLILLLLFQWIELAELLLSPKWYEGLLAIIMMYAGTIVSTETTVQGSAAGPSSLSKIDEVQKCRSKSDGCDGCDLLGLAYWEQAKPRDSNERSAGVGPPTQHCVADLLPLESIRL